MYYILFKCFLFVFKRIFKLANANLAEERDEMKNKYDEEIDFKYNMKLYLEFLRKYKLLFFAILFFLLLYETGGIIEKYLLKIVIDNGTKFSEKTLELNAFLQILMVVALVFSVWVLAKALLNWVYLHLNNKIDSKLMQDLKIKFFNHIISLDHSFHVSHRTGTLISRINRGASAIERMTDTIIFNFSPLIIQLIVAGASLAYFGLAQFAVVLVVMIAFFSFSFILQHFRQGALVRATRAEDWEKGAIADIITNVDSIKYFGKDVSIQRKFLKITNNTLEVVLKSWNYNRWMKSVPNLILGIGTFVLFYLSISDFLAGRMTLGTVAFVYTVYLGLMSTLNSFIGGIRDFYRIMADFEALFQYNKIEKEIKDAPNARELKVRDGTIEFRKMGFNYEQRTIFNDFNLKIKKNEKIALVGHSGCGKTTLIKLLYRFYDVSSGGILIDGKDIRELKQESLRGEMSVVPQECVLFDDTIYNNIAFSNPRASRQEVMQAIRFAQLDKIIKQFPNRENTIVGERGVKLSGGEKQRVSIARAILANKKILVLDEATSSLDSETESEIKKDLERLMEGRTSIVIVHRLSTIMKADRIIVMKQGKIVQQGRHSQLIEKPGEYKKLWNLQKGGYI